MEKKPACASMWGTPCLSHEFHDPAGDFHQVDIYFRLHGDGSAGVDPRVAGCAKESLTGPSMVRVIQNCAPLSMLYSLAKVAFDSDSDHLRPVEPIVRLTPARSHQAPMRWRTQPFPERFAQIQSAGNDRRSRHHSCTTAAVACASFGNTAYQQRALFPAQGHRPAHHASAIPCGCVEGWLHKQPGTATSGVANIHKVTPRYLPSGSGMPPLPIDRDRRSTLSPRASSGCPQAGID